MKDLTKLQRQIIIYLKKGHKIEVYSRNKIEKFRVKTPQNEVLEKGYYLNIPTMTINNLVEKGYLDKWLNLLTP